MAHCDRAMNTTLVRKFGNFIGQIILNVNGFLLVSLISVLKMWKKEFWFPRKFLPKLAFKTFTYTYFSLY